MADLDVSFLHPTDGRTVSVTLSDFITATEAIGELINNHFIDANRDGYNIAVKGGRQLLPSETFADAGIKDNDIIRIIPATLAGGELEAIKPSAIPGLSKRDTDKFTIQDVQKSPEAIIMIVNLYDDLQAKYERQAKELEYERLKSNDRLVATLLLLVSQVILSIGVNLLTSSNWIALPVLVAGGAQAILAVFLTFRKPKN